MEFIYVYIYSASLIRKIHEWSHIIMLETQNNI